MRLPSQMQRSTQTSNKSSAPVVSAEAHKLPVRLTIKRTRGYRGPKCPLDRKVAHLCSRSRVADEHAADLSHEDHQAGRTRWIRLDTPLHRREPVRSFVDRSKMCVQPNPSCSAGL